MSIQTILASGFLLLGGALLLVVSSLDYSDFYTLFGLLFTLAGAVPLLIHPVSYTHLTLPTILLV